MAACSTCGARNPGRARFCHNCGKRLAEQRAAESESRRTVTVLFADIVGSTALGEAADAEVVRSAVGQAFAAMRGTIERHGGTVEKFVGDAVMAIFGLPTLHEDDALRAARAAAELEEELAILNEDLEPRLGRELSLRVGLSTGEVVAGDPSRGETLATGDTVNTAARLEQAANPGEILLGPVTARLVRGAARLQAVPPIAAKGKAEPIPAFRLVSIGSSPPRPTDMPLVGREAELASLRSEFERVVTERTPAIVTLLGAPGVGKSRLVAELLATIGDRATILRGRCLSYGDGLTYWPLREIVLAATGTDESPDEAEPLLRDRIGDEGAVIADRLATAVGLREGSVSAEEIHWAARRTFERLSADRPLVLVVEDIHWARPPMLELLEHIVRESNDAPILIVCPARPDLRETSPEWGKPPNARTLELEGLTQEASERLIDSVAESANQLPNALRQRILETAEGNPLFVEEMVRLVVETGDTSLAIPPTIEALMATRIDRLPAPERTVAQRGSVVGRVFERAAVTALLVEPARRSLGARLGALVRKQLLRREGQARAGDPSFKFRHILIRDAAYNGLAKAERAELHEAFARWLAGTIAGMSGEFEEIVGFHLEQAYRYRVELRESGHRLDELGQEAALRLTSAAHAASDRGDELGADRLFERAVSLPGWDDIGRVELLVAWSRTLLNLAELDDAAERADEALSLATGLGDRRLTAQARVRRLEVLTTNGTIVNPSDDVRVETDLALADAEFSGDPRALWEAWTTRSIYTYLLGDLKTSIVEQRSALEAVGKLDDERLILETQAGLLTMALVGSSPATEVVAIAEDLRRRAATFPPTRGESLRLAAPAEAMLGRFDDARRHIAESLAIGEDLRRPWDVMHILLDSSWVERLAGDLAAAERACRRALEIVDRLGDRTLYAFGAARLAVVLVALGRFEEALPFIASGESVPGITNRSRMIGARARIRASTGDVDAREDLARMLEPLATTGFMNVKTDALVDAGDVEAALGDRDAAARYLAEALDLCERKENLVLAEQVRARIGGLGVAWHVPA